jgi:hypothetical protein
VNFHFCDRSGIPPQFCSLPGIPPRVPTRPTTASELGSHAPYYAG